MKNFTSRRSFIFTPPLEPKMFDKAVLSGSDIVCLELEDGVLPKDKIALVKGWFQDTVASHKDKVGEIAVLRLDGDWYESTKIPLENFYPYISPGGCIIIDDYATCFGSKKATDEFIAENLIDTYLRPDGRGGAWFVKPY